MVFICGQRKPKANAPRDFFFFSNGYVNYLTSVIGKLSQTNLPLSLCFGCREVKIHFLRFWNEKLRRQSPPLMELWDSTSALFRSLLIPTWTPFGSYTGMPGTRMLQVLLCGTEHLLGQHRVLRRKGAQLLPNALLQPESSCSHEKSPHPRRQQGKKSEQWEVKWGFIFKQQCLLMYLVPDK